LLREERADQFPGVVAELDGVVPGDELGDQFLGVGQGADRLAGDEQRDRELVPPVFGLYRGAVVTAAAGPP
jgi:hypothetical protein